MKLPNFIIIGVQKAGTTSIYNYLKQHPQVYMSSVKETNFFERDWQDVRSQKGERPRGRIDTFEKYTQLFNGVTHEIAIGEASPNYLFHHQESAPRIKKYLPQVKLIAILRNPVERAYSDYLMHMRDAIGKPRSLAEQVKSSPESSFTLLKGRYHNQLKHYFDEFGPDTVKVYLYHELCENAVKLMQDMYCFIGVDGTFSPNTATKAQVAKIPKNKMLNTLIKTKNPVRSFAASALRLFFPEAVRRKLRSGIIEINLQDKESAPLSSSDRQLLLDYYHEDILKLQDLLQRDLSVWLN